MLVYDLTNRGKKSKYEYLYQCLKEDILSGKLAEGEKMPSKRRLSEANGISIRTVMNADGGIFGIQRAEWLLCGI